MCLCICVCLCVCICLCVSVSLCVSLFVSVSICVSVSVRVSLCIWKMHTHQTLVWHDDSGGRYRSGWHRAREGPQALPGTPGPRTLRKAVGGCRVGAPALPPLPATFLGGSPALLARTPPTLLPATHRRTGLGTAPHGGPAKRGVGGYGDQGGDPHLSLMRLPRQYGTISSPTGKPLRVPLRTGL